MSGSTSGADPSRVRFADDGARAELERFSKTTQRRLEAALEEWESRVFANSDEAAIERLRLKREGNDTVVGGIAEAFLKIEEPREEVRLHIGGGIVARVGLRGDADSGERYLEARELIGLRRREFAVSMHFRSLQTHQSTALSRARSVDDAAERRQEDEEFLRELASYARDAVQFSPPCEECSRLIAGRNSEELWAELRAALESAPDPVEAVGTVVGRYAQSLMDAVARHPACFLPDTDKLDKALREMPRDWSERFGQLLERRAILNEGCFHGPGQEDAEEAIDGTTERDFLARYGKPDEIEQQMDALRDARSIVLDCEQDPGEIDSAMAELERRRVLAVAMLQRLDRKGWKYNREQGTLSRQRSNASQLRIDIERDWDNVSFLGNTEPVRRAFADKLEMNYPPEDLDVSRGGKLDETIRNIEKSRRAGSSAAEKTPHARNLEGG